MSLPTYRHPGFSTVELLVTLFVAVVFLTAGNQLYNAVTRDSGEARQRARASNIAYNTLRQEVEKTPAVCANSTPTDNKSVTPDPEGLTNVKLTVAYICPPTSPSSITKVQVTVTYGTDEKEVVHAIYALH